MTTNCNRTKWRSTYVCMYECAFYKCEFIQRSIYVETEKKLYYSELIRNSNMTFLK